MTLGSRLVTCKGLANRISLWFKVVLILGFSCLTLVMNVLMLLS